MHTPRKGKAASWNWILLYNLDSFLPFSYSTCRSSDSTRYGTNKSSGASSGSHRKSVGSAGGGGGGGSNGGGGGGGGYNSLMQQTVSNQQQQQRSLFAQQQRQQKPNYKYNANSNNSSSSSTNPNHNHNHNPNQSLAPVHGASSSANTNSTPPPAESRSGSANRLLSYTTFENNQYKFSLNNALAKGSAGGGGGGGGGGSSSNLLPAAGGAGGGGGVGAFSRQRSFVEWPNNPAAPYYYQGPSTSVSQVKRRDAKSDIGVPTRRLSGQSVTKTQLLSGGGGGSSQLANASCYPMHYASSSVTNASFSRALGQRGHNGHGHGMGHGGGGAGVGFGLQPAKSDLFLSYIHGGEYERPYIYNYKMPQMPPGLAGNAAGSGSGSGSRSGSGSGSGSPKQQQQQQQASAYHISGAQTADPPPPPLYGGSAPANDVMYYQFDKGAAAQQPQPQPQPIVQQPKSAGGAGAGGGGGAGSGPLVYLQHGQNVAPTNVTSASTQQTVSKPGHVPCQHVA